MKSLYLPLDYLLDWILLHEPSEVFLQCNENEIDWENTKFAWERSFKTWEMIQASQNCTPPGKKNATEEEQMEGKFPGYKSKSICTSSFSSKGST